MDKVWPFALGALFAIGTLVASHLVRLRVEGAARVTSAGLTDEERIPQYEPEPLGQLVMWGNDLATGVVSAVIPIITAATLAPSAAVVVAAVFVAVVAGAIFVWGLVVGPERYATADRTRLGVLNFVVVLLNVILAVVFGAVAVL